MSDLQHREALCMHAEEMFQTLKHWAVTLDSMRKVWHENSDRWCPLPLTVNLWTIIGKVEREAAADSVP